MPHTGSAACMHAPALSFLQTHAVLFLCCRLIGLLQLVALVVFCIAWPTVLGYTVFLYNCDWSNIQEGLPAVHVYFTEQSECSAVGPQQQTTADTAGSCIELELFSTCCVLRDP